MPTCPNCTTKINLTPQSIPSVVCPECGYRMAVVYRATADSGYAYYTHDLFLERMLNDVK